MTSPRDTVVAAMVAGTDPAKTVSELCVATGLARSSVTSAIAELADEQRAMRDLTDQDGALVVRWRLRR